MNGDLANGERENEAHPRGEAVDFEDAVSEGAPESGLWRRSHSTRKDSTGSLTWETRSEGSGSGCRWMEGVPDRSIRCRSRDIEGDGLGISPRGWFGNGSFERGRASTALQRFGTHLDVAQVGQGKKTPPMHPCNPPKRYEHRENARILASSRGFP